MTKATTITKLLGNFLGEDFALQIRDKDDNELYTYTSGDVVDYMLQHYGDWSFVYNGASGYTIIYPNDSLATFIGQWIEYVNTNKDNWSKIGVAYKMEYNPIENYNRTETITGTTEWTETGGGSFNNNGTQSAATDTSTHSYGNGDGISSMRTTNKSTTYDSTEPVQTTSSEVEGAETTNTNLGERTNVATGTSNYNKSGSTTDKDKTTKASGNIGVSTSQMMLTEELQLRRFNMFTYIMDTFAKQYLVLLPGGDDNDCCFW